MISKLEEQKAQLIDKLIATLQARLPKQTAAMAETFARHYFAWAAPEDLLDDDPEDLYGATLAHWNFARQRPPQTAVIRVYNPSFDEHGWQSTHTVLEIVTDDMPFLVDSVTMELNRHGLTVHRVIHPVMRIIRNDRGHLEKLLPAEARDGIAEAIIHLEVDRQTDAATLTTLQRDITRILDDVRATVKDWQPMRQRLLEIVDELVDSRSPLPAAELEETLAFLRWMANNHFTFLGYRCYDLREEQQGELTLSTVADSGLGILSDDQSDHISRSFAILPQQQRELVFAPTLLILTKASAHSTVHRPAHLDYVGIKRFNAESQVIGEWRFLGLYTSLAYSIKPADIPLLRRKVERVMERAELAPVSHSGKVFQHILDTFPRDQLFQASEDELFDIAMGILHLQERQRLRLFTLTDAFGRFVSCFVYVPRDHYNTELRRRMQDILMEALNGESSEFTTQFTESILARVLFTIRTTPGKIPEFSTAELEARLYEAMLSWRDELQRVMLEQCGEARGNDLFQRYGDAFPAAYKDDFTSRTAVSDILRLEQLSAEQLLQMRLYRPLEEPEGLLRFKIFGPQQPIPLSDVLPILERLGLRVLTARPYEIETRSGDRLWVLDFDLKEAHGIQVDEAQVRNIFQESFARIWKGEMENDGFNRLVLGARLAWRDVVMLRAYCKYLRQARVTFSQTYMERTLGNHPHIARLLAELFHARFDPHLLGDHGRRTTALEVHLDEALEQVSNLDEDRILRRFLNIVQATLRTNFFQTDDQGNPQAYLSFKFDPALIQDLPLPRPMFEIFVYSPRIEGVHLRGGPVARGGLRWSDRQEDFRTEVLGLVKAQMVKNSVIVPVGSKGGFIVKHPPSGREELQKEVVECYSTFIRGMLDLTDNLVRGNVISPPQVVRYDKDDSYLVVAADKGTATFSDLANGIAKDYGFWLGDAFASGGSAGYDHKKMGITARGAWESVKRHFRELGKDIQNRDDFTVVGIGDMAGDVFGNGMLLSRHIKLVAAFNHMHIFLDPDPDPAIGYQERERLFELPRSSWEDYNPELISAGGGVYPRSAKSIQLSPQARAVLDIKTERLTPNELLHNLLKAPVDLLWNGGIGTYVKATSETHADADDRANDAVRINGKQLRCKVVGEGGNLGLTQLGRIEYARHGGKVLTDAIDNSGGVNCSDHEVNIKILLNQAVSNGDMTEKQRNQLLAEMTDEVAQLVLRQNYLQPEALSVTTALGSELMGDHVRVMRTLEKAGKLDRAIEFLPDDEEIAAREAAHQGFSPPELAVLLAYGKITMQEALLASDVPEDPYLQQELSVYFPTPLRERFVKEMEAHPLRREIIATYITNSILNRMGSSFPFRLQEETGESFPNIARAYTAAREMFNTRQLWTDIATLDNQVPADFQIAMLGYSRRLLARASLWLLRHRRVPLAIETVVTQFSPGITTLRKELPKLLRAAELEQMEQARQHFAAKGIPEELAQWIASLDALYSALDLVEVASQAELSIEVVGAVYFEVVSHLELNWLRESITELPISNHWQNRARVALMNSLYDQGSSLTADVLRLTSAEQGHEKRVATWLEHNRAGVERCRAMFADLRAAGQPDLAMLSVAVREAANLVQRSA